MGTRRQWAKDFAAALGNANPSASTLSWISAWLAKENTRARFNPLATTYNLPPNTDFNSVGVKNFATRNQGIEATVRTLRGAHAGYADIIKGIATNDPQTAANGLMVAPWGTNGAAVMAVWKTSDVGDAMLKSEPETATSSSIAKPEPPPSNVPLHTPERIPLDGVNPIGPESANQETYVSPYGELTPSIRTAYVIGGFFLVLVAGFLAFKTYVPVTTIAKTVAEVAL